MTGTFPKAQIQIYHGASLLYTITDDFTDLIIKEVLNDVGTFSFTLPTKVGTDSYNYYDIAVFDKVKVTVYYDTLPATPTTVGYVYKITAPCTDSVVRTFHCYNQTEILARRLKTKYYSGITAKTIADEIASDLGLGAGLIDPEANVVTENFDCEPYIDILKRISDYWVSGSTLIQKDWLVDVDNNLVWKNRPLRTANVETVTLGQNVIAYQVHRDLQSVKNAITVYGYRGIREPSEVTDTWCESTTGWTGEPAYFDTLATDAADFKKNTVSVYADHSSAVAFYLRFYYTPTETIYCGEGNTKYDHLHFFLKTEDNGPSIAFLYVNTATATFTYNLLHATGYTHNAWTEYDIPIGPQSEVFTAGVGDKNCWNEKIKNIEFISYYGYAGTLTMKIDDMYFHSKRYFSPEVTDAGSITDYGRRELVTVDNSLLSNSECLNRANSLLYQLKDPIIRADVTVVGNPNIIVGDQLSLTFPAENISAATHTVTSAEYKLSEPSGFITNFTAVNTNMSRTVPAVSVNEVLKQKFDATRQIGRGEQFSP